MSSKLSKSIYVVTAFFLFCGLGSLFRVSVAIAMEDVIEAYQPSAFMLIEAKSMHSIVASKRKFEIMRETRIFDGGGREIRIQNLPVPCKAQVDYETFAYSDPIALKILIKEVFPGASINWSDSMPE